MIDIKIKAVYGEAIALHAMRHPMKWHYNKKLSDYELSRKLVNAGTEHGKHLRMIQAWIELNLPRYMWVELDTYQFSTKISESTIHTLHQRHLTQSDFERPILDTWLDDLNKLIDIYNEEKHIEAFLNLKAHLPEGFLQRRTLNTNYQQILNIIKQRHNHKIYYWDTLCKELVNTIPNFIDLVGKEMIPWKVD